MVLELLLLTLAAGPHGLERLTARPPPPSVEKRQADFQGLLDANAQQIVTDAIRVQVLRLASIDHGTRLAFTGEKDVAGWAVESESDLPGPLSAETKRVVLQPENYAVTYGNKMCGGFRPKVVFRFWSAKQERVDVLLCFDCSDVVVITPTAHSWPTDMGEQVRAWLARAKKALPKDVQIQSFQAR